MANLVPAPSEHGASPITDGAVGGVLGDSEVICMGAQGAKQPKTAVSGPGSSPHSVFQQRFSIEIEQGTSHIYVF